jgi:hypothetical protein
MAATSLHMGYQFPELTKRTLKAWFLINSPARRNISTRFRTRCIITTISLSKPFVTSRRIFTCASISLSKTYKWQGRLAPKHMLYLLSFLLINPWEWHLGAKTCSIWYLTWSVFYCLFCCILFSASGWLKYGKWIVFTCIYLHSQPYLHVIAHFLHVTSVLQLPSTEQ